MRALRTLRPCLLAAIGTLVAAAPGVASASPTYPDLIGTDLSLTYSLGVDHCTICHSSNSGGVGTAIQPFATAMKAAGLTLEDPAALKTALATLEANGTDSDCDKIPDIEQIEGGRDPNTGAYIDGSGKATPAGPGCGSTTTGGLPTFGCEAKLAPGAAGAGSAGLVAAAMLGASVARRRRRDAVEKPSRRVAGPPLTLCVACHAAVGSDAAHTPSPGGRDFVYTPVQ